MFLTYATYDPHVRSLLGPFKVGRSSLAGAGVLVTSCPFEEEGLSR